MPRGVKGGPKLGQSRALGAVESGPPGAMLGLLPKARAKVERRAINPFSALIGRPRGKRK